MTPEQAMLLAELEAFGREHDASAGPREARMLNVTRGTGELLRVLVQATGARRVLEIGTSNAYSTIWLALGVQATRGTVTTVERAAAKVALARRTLASASLEDRVTILHGEADEVLRRRAGASADLLFLDADRAQYVAWWPDVDRVLRPGGLLVVDNVVSHAAELAAFVEVVAAAGGYATCIVPLGNGEFLATKSTRGAS